MQSEFLELIEPTPKLHSQTCRFGAFLLFVFLSYFPLLFSLLTWYLYDYFIAGTLFLLSFLIIGIIRSKLRNEVIPPTQREFHYTDKAIADWYLSKRVCS